MRELLVKSYPFIPIHCGRELCWPCSGPMSLPSDKPTIPGRPNKINESIYTYFVHISQEVEEVGQREVGGGRGELGEQSTNISRKPVLKLVSQLSLDVCDIASRSSPDLVVAQVEEQFNLQEVEWIWSCRKVRKEIL